METHEKIQRDDDDFMLPPNVTILTMCNWLIKDYTHALTHTYTHSHIES